MGISNSNLINGLVRLGLNHTESTVYILALQFGTARAGELVKASTMPRATVYGAITSLTRRGLLSRISSDSGDIYSPELPQRIVFNAEDKIREAQDLAQHAKSLLPMLLGISGIGKIAGNIRIFEGENAVKRVLFDSLQGDSDYVRTYVNVDDMDRHIKSINQEYVEERKRLRIFKRALILDTPFARKRMETYDRTVSNFKMLPLPGLGFHGEFQIYSGKVSYVTYRDSRLLGFIVDSPDLYCLQKALFERIWGQIS